MKIKEPYIRVAGIVLVGFTFPFLLNIQNASYLRSALFSTFYSAIHWQGAMMFIYYYRKRFAGFEQTQKRIIYEFISVILFTILVNYGLIYTIDVIIFKHPNTDYFLVSRIFAQALFLSLAITAVYDGFYFFEQLQKNMLENEKLKGEQIQAQFSVLKNQVSPHFLFNSFNTLMSIIPESPDIALQFTEKLSSVYRYILETKDQELVSLSTELDFLNSYIFLQKIRFGNNLQIDIELDDHYLNTQIPPLTLQMLVENAIKHNIISTAKPLHVLIHVENGKSLVVKNNLQKKNQVQESTQIGLQNIMHRYQYLTHKEVDVIVTPQNFIVTLPLIFISEKHYESIDR